MRKITMWMVLMAIAVTPLMAQEAESSDTEEQQIDQAIEEAIGGEAAEPVMEEPAMEGFEEVFMEEPAMEEVGEPFVEEVEEPVMEEVEDPVMEEVATGGPEAEAGERPFPEEPEYRERPAQREVQTLMSGSGGYGAISVGYTEINNLPALMMGLSAEWVIGHGFGLGIKGVGFTSDFTPVGEDFYAMSGGYGGLVMEPILFGWFPVHLAFPITIGGGGVASYATTADLWDYDNIDPYFGEYAVFFVGELGVELEFNLVKFFRLALFGSYRWTPTLDMKPMYGLTDPSPYAVSGDALEGFSFGARFKFGSF